MSFIERVVPTAGLEPAHLTVLAPQASASTNSATSAIVGSKSLRGPASETTYFGASGAGVVAGAGAAVAGIAGNSLTGAGAGATGTCSIRLFGPVVVRWLAM